VPGRREVARVGGHAAQARSFDLGEQPCHLRIGSRCGADQQHDRRDPRGDLDGAGDGDWTIVRATAFRELWIDVLAKTAARSGRPVVCGRGDNPINFVSVMDVAGLVEQAVTDPATRGRILEIGGPDNFSFNQLAAAIQQAARRPAAPRHVPPMVLRLVARSAGYLRPELGRQARAALVMDRADLSFEATGIRQAYPSVSCTPLSMCLAQ
jgi:NADH dehydrogenase